MDDVAIWNRALTASEIKLLYAAGSESGRGLETLLGAWKKIIVPKRNHSVRSGFECL